MFVFLAVTEYKELSVFLNVVYAYTFPTTFNKNFPSFPFLYPRSPIVGLIIDLSFPLKIHEITARETAQWVTLAWQAWGPDLQKADSKAASNPRGQEAEPGNPWSKLKARPDKMATLGCSERLQMCATMSRFLQGMAENAVYEVQHPYI